LCFLAFSGLVSTITQVAEMFWVMMAIDWRAALGSKSLRQQNGVGRQGSYRIHLQDHRMLCVLAMSMLHEGLPRGSNGRISPYRHDASESLLGVKIMA
jgi:hypothetical protein